jgi:drug/metabolite transporter, DME family
VHNVVSAAFVALAALGWGLSGGIAGILLDNGWSALLVSFYRGAVGLLFVLIWLMLRPRNSGLSSPKLWFWSVIAGLGVAGNFTFYFLSIGEGSVAIAATLMYSAPVLVYFVSFTLGLEKPTSKKWCAIALVMLGIVLLTQVHDIGGSDLTLLGVGAGLLAGLSYATFIFGFKYAASHGSPQAILSIAFTVLVLVLIWPSDINKVAGVLSSPDVLLFAGLGVFGAGLTFILYIVGLNYTAAAVASVVAMIEPVTASLFGVLVLRESLGGLQILGMVLIVITVTALSVRTQ